MCSHKQNAGFQKLLRPDRADWAAKEGFEFCGTDKPIYDSLKNTIALAPRVEEINEIVTVVSCG
jgi:hypothetical protein